MLGWPDPKPAPECECQEDGCHEWATGGRPTPDGYKWLCGRHFAKYEARAEAAEASAEKYKSFFDDVAEKPNCNTCADQKCTYRPNPGEITRFNCPLWRGQKEKIEVRFFDESSKFTEEQWEFIKKRFLKTE